MPAFESRSEKLSGGGEVFFPGRQRRETPREITPFLQIFHKGVNPPHGLLRSGTPPPSPGMGYDEGGGEEDLVGRPSPVGRSKTDR
ncbi:MAG: hypothetical protein KJ950_16260 [Proteobacteria bacterium]|nr:hypothetical protein [Pseudomonadota bacterium]MBU1685885.1 hypothetical protein [Pseudomonadota bacterium]